MKRAILVSAGTLAGVAAVLTYSPASPGVVDLSAPGSAHLTGTVTDTTSPSSAAPSLVQPSSAEPRPSATKGTHQKAKPRASHSPSPTPSGSTGSPTASPSTQTKTSTPSTSSTPRATPKPSATQRSTPTPTPKTTPKPSPKPTPKPTPTPSPTPSPQSFTASAQMHYGTITVTVTVTGGKLTDVRGSAALAPQDGRSARINSRALPTLRSEALAAKSANIATVSGATLTSVAYKQALQAALNQAGL
jgi:uncharacterized protein with FMN-binding domain